MRKRIVQAASNQLENTLIIFQQFPCLNKEQMLFQFISNCKRKQKNTNTNNGLHFINILFKHDDIASACIPWTRSHYSSVVKHRGAKNVQYTTLSESKFNIHNEWYHWKDDLRIFGQQGTILVLAHGIWTEDNNAGNNNLPWTYQLYTFTIQNKGRCRVLLLTSTIQNPAKTQTNFRNGEKKKLRSPKATKVAEITLNAP